MSKKQSCFVYIMEAMDCAGPVGLVKIGISSKPIARLSTLRTACPYKLRIYHWFEFPEREMAACLEGGFHSIKAPHQQKGEWFRMGANDAHRALCEGIRAFLLDDVWKNPKWAPYLRPTYERYVGMVWREA